MNFYSSCLNGRFHVRMAVFYWNLQIFHIFLKSKGTRYNANVYKKIEEFSYKINSPIISIPGISHFSGTSILAEIEDICNYSKASKLAKLAGVAPYEHESSQYRAEHTAN